MKQPPKGTIPAPVISTVATSRVLKTGAPHVVTSSAKKAVIDNSFFLKSTYEALDAPGALLDLHQKNQQQTGIKAKSGLMLRVSERDLGAGGNAGALVQTTVDPEIRLSFVNSLILSKATRETGLTGNYIKPYFATSAAPLAYPSEGSAASDQSNQTFGALTLSPAALAFSTTASRQVLVQSKANLAGSIINDANRVANSYLEGFALGAINAVGNIPSKGILTSSVNPSSGNTDFSKTNFFTTDLSSSISNTKLSTAVSSVEATAASDDGSFLFITSPAGASKLRTTSIGGSNNRFLAENNLILGDARLPLAASPYLTGVTGNLIFGRVSDLLIATWSMELTVDPYTNMTSDQVIFNWILWCNVGLLHGPSFVVGSGGNL